MFPSKLSALLSLAILFSLSLALSVPANCPYGSYTVSKTDSCASISRAKSVSALSLAAANNLPSGCPKLAAGQTLCLPQTCKVFVVEKGYTTCQAIIKRFQIGYFAPLYYNPGLTDCSHLKVGDAFCISLPGAPQ